jgi:hypothetical protein
MIRKIAGKAPLGSAPLGSAPLGHTGYAPLRLINAPGADFRRHQVNRVRSDDNILGIHLIDFRDGAGILIFTFHKQLLIILTNTNKAGFIQRTRPVVQDDGLIFQNGDFGRVLKACVRRNAANGLIITVHSVCAAAAAICDCDSSISCACAGGCVCCG